MTHQQIQHIERGVEILAKTIEIWTAELAPIAARTDWHSQEEAKRLGSLIKNSEADLLQRKALVESAKAADASAVEPVPVETVVPTRAKPRGSGS